MKVLIGLIFVAILVPGFEEKQFAISEEVKNILKNARIGGIGKPFNNINWSNTNTKSDYKNENLEYSNPHFSTQKSTSTSSPSTPTTYNPENQIPSIKNPPIP